MRNLDIFVLAAALFAGSSLSAQSWVIGPFMRPSEAPVIEPNKFYYFTDPITQEKTFWDAGHTFSPAATIAPNAARSNRGLANCGIPSGPLVQDFFTKLFLHTKRNNRGANAGGRKIQKIQRSVV